MVNCPGRTAALVSEADPYIFSILLLPVGLSTFGHLHCGIPLYRFWMVIPFPTKCSEKLRLAMVLTNAHRRIIAMHNLAVKALTDSDLQTDAILWGELEVERAMVRLARYELHAHIIGHHC